MPKILIFQDAFFVSSIMCHTGCGNTIDFSIRDAIDQLKQAGVLLADVDLQIDAEPVAPGIHTISIVLESESQVPLPPETAERVKNTIQLALKDMGVELSSELGSDKNESSAWVNWINIAVNLLAIGAIISLSLLFPPSILLTLGLSAIALGVTAFTARDHIKNFVLNLRARKLSLMPATITLGWLLSLGHILYHAFLMPIASSFSMVFMNFLMPVTLMTGVNIMDEIQRLIAKKSKKLQLQGLTNLFPEMAKDYPCYQLDEEEQQDLSRCLQVFIDNPGTDSPIEASSALTSELTEMLSVIRQRLSTTPTNRVEKKLLRQGMLISVARGQCFPVDCLLIEGTTTVDASLLTGESRLSKCPLDKIPAGAINLGNQVTVYATANAYHSTVNRLLFRSNRGKKPQPIKSDNKWLYLYLALTMLTLVISIALPLALGIFALPILLQNAMSLFFGLCPCMIALAQQLPSLLSSHQRGRKGIVLRDQRLLDPGSAIHTVVFDKTGTLTTGHCQVHDCEGISEALLQRVFLLEQAHGADHPIARGIISFYEAKKRERSLIQTIEQARYDSKNRGLSAKVQGQLIHVGNAEYFRDCGINLPQDYHQKKSQGFTPVCVAENGQFKGVINMKHEIRPGILASLRRLKSAGITIIMLTGDTLEAAQAFNRQQGSIFAEEDIFAAQTPEAKEQFLKQRMSADNANPAGFWFIGDGLNDAPCARIVSELGGTSCAMTAEDKSAFFTDIRLDGSIDYLFHHNKLNRFLKKNTIQNQWIMIYGTLIMLAFVISFSLMGLALPPFIPLLAMLTTSGLVLFNAYRSRLSVDAALDRKPSIFTRFMASDLSMGLLVSAASLLVVGLLLSTLASGGLALPVIAFSAGTLTALSSGCLLASLALFAGFSLMAGGFIIQRKLIPESSKEPILPSTEVITSARPPLPLVSNDQVVPFDLTSPSGASAGSGYGVSPLQPAGMGQ